jgi:hypothetical protein
MIQRSERLWKGRQDAKRICIAVGNEEGVATHPVTRQILSNLHSVRKLQGCTASPVLAVGPVTWISRDEGKVWSNSLYRGETFACLQGVRKTGENWEIGDCDLVSVSIVD